MASTIAHSWFSAPDTNRRKIATSEPFWVRALLITLAVAFFGLFLLLPLGVVFAEAFKKGWAGYAAGVLNDDALSAIKLTLLVAADRRARSIWSLVSPPRGLSPSSIFAASSSCCR